MNKILAIGALLTVGLSLTACEIKISEVPKSSSECPVKEDMTAAEFKSVLTSEIQASRYRCVETQLIKAKGRLVVREAFGDLHKLLADTNSAIPETTKVHALGYLLFADDPEAPRLLENNVVTIRKVAMGGAEEHRATALSVLSTRRSDEDIDIFLSAIESGDEVALAYGAFSLADNCSTQARQRLATALKSPPMMRYLEKYAGRESISATIRSKCPALAQGLSG